MEITKILKYLTDISVFNKVLSFEEITMGKGGAKIYKINAGEKIYILKSAHKDFGLDDEGINSYIKELNFYNLSLSLNLPFVPKPVYTEIHPEYGIIILMDCYKTLSPAAWTSELQMKAADLCAKFNSIAFKKLDSMELKWNPTVIDENFSKNSLATWLKVLDEHKGKFDPYILDIIYKNLKEIAAVLNEPPHYFCHGDFHPENILTDGEKLYICDFQGLNIGKCAGDINFFISRGSSMGINIDSEKLLSYYAERLSQYTGKETDTETLEKERCASSLLVTFSFWADYLHNADFIKVKLHYDEMVNAAKFLDIM